MTANSDLIKQRISAIYAELAAGPNRPSYSINGQSVSWNEYRSGLMNEIKELRDQMALADGPWEIDS